MGYITLPSLDDILLQKDPKQQMEMLINTVGLLMKSLTEINGYLTTTNIKELHAKVIKAGTVTAEKMDVQELSAITANLGKVTSGEMYGAYIATAEGTYPRTEMSTTGNYLGAFLNAINSMQIVPTFDGVPALVINVSGLEAASLSANASALNIAANARDINIETAVQGNINITPETGYNVVFPLGFASIYGAGSENLAVELFAKATKGASTGSGGGVTLNGGIPIGTSLAVDGGGSFTWAGITVPSHTHTQT